MKTKSLHWSSRNLISYQMAITIPFLAQIEKRMQLLLWTPRTLATKSGIALNRLLKILDSDVFPTVRECIRLSQATNFSMSLVALPHDYRQKGPVNPEVLSMLWHHARCPTDVFEVEEFLFPLQKKAKPKKARKT